MNFRVFPKTSCTLQQTFWKTGKPPASCSELSAILEIFPQCAAGFLVTIHKKDPEFPDLLK
ncbi:hypothetical protein [Chryseobacterium taichungense]|uniref:hypothetical protein n=1 Tax=Chryseobacterium taichungense TaxID=295069 RepID=UPI000B7D99E3|nr:hypothetical protein [Chryseobacterium taichungense]